MSNPEIDAKIEEGISFFDQNNIPKAIITLREVLKNDEGSDLSSKGHYYLSLAYFQNDNLQEAFDELPKCGAYAPAKVFDLIKNISAKSGDDYKEIANSLPQKDLYAAIVEQENQKRNKEASAAAAERDKQAEADKLKLETEGDYNDLFVETMKAAPTNYLIPFFMGVISIPAWGLGLLLAGSLPKAIIRFAVQYAYYYMYTNSHSIHNWTLTNINLSNIFGYTPFVNSLNEYVFPGLQIVFAVSTLILSLQSFVFAYFEWYKIFIFGNVVEVRNTNDVYINVGFEHHINLGDVFNIYTRGKKPVLKGNATILKHEDAVSLVEFRPNTELQVIMQPKIGDIVKFKWL